MRRLNPDQLATLVEVASLGGFSQAARRLNLTQPAVSLQIRELEQRFGVQLIERIGKEARATAPGRDLIERATRILGECDLADMAMRRYRDGWLGRVRIGSTLTALMYELPPILKKLRADHPGIDLSVANMPTRESVDGIVQNTLDLGLITLPVDEERVRITVLRHEMLVAILPAETPDVPDVVTPDYVAREALVVEHAGGAVFRLIMKWLADHTPLPQPPMHIGTIEAVKKGVASGLGLSIVPDISVADHTPDIIVRPLHPPLPCPLALIEHRDRQSDAAFVTVRDAILTLRG